MLRIVEYEKRNHGFHLWVLCFQNFQNFWKEGNFFFWMKSSWSFNRIPLTKRKQKQQKQNKLVEHDSSDVKNTTYWSLESKDSKNAYQPIQVWSWTAIRIDLTYSGVGYTFLVTWFPMIMATEQLYPFLPWFWATHWRRGKKTQLSWTRKNLLMRKGW